MRILLVVGMCLAGVLGCLAEEEVKVEEVRVKKGDWVFISAEYSEGLLPEFDGYFVIEKSGLLIVPPIGEVRNAVGMTMTELKKALQGLYEGKKRLDDVEVTTEVKLRLASEIKTIPVDLKEKKQAMLIGMVNKPGKVITVGDGMALSEVLELGGGATAFGSTRRVQLFLAEKKWVYDLRKPEHQKILVKAGARVYVPQKHWVGR